ncbi:MAG TPA: class I SAM-dependent methyltransferase [Longimicrobiales bacterium]|nr:class I SAM-dependent methyltransferase [Longimicrobiales bacterium]
MSSTRDPTLRFSDRAADYERGRPTYPSAVVELLQERVGLAPGWVVADIGSGTGISIELFLDRGYEVHAVEPNAEMRAAAERRLGGRPGFRSVPGTAERTSLPGASVDLVVAAQAFHWFDPLAARHELSRILRPPGWAAVIWNVRHDDATPFLRGYEKLLRRHATDYERVRRAWANEAALAVFFPHGLDRAVVPNEQVLDYEGLRRRLVSSSYVPAPASPRHEPMLADLRALFDTHQEAGAVRMTYDCLVMTGCVSRGA